MQLTLLLFGAVTLFAAPASRPSDSPEVGKAELGKPLVLKFKATDGREVDLAKLKGKVVLVDFWATWCGPCMRELPSVKATYDKLHGKGFEIVGISFDQKKEALARIVKREKMAWPQYFETRSEEHRIGEKLGSESIPTMWLIDKEGNLRDLDARHNLAGRVEKLLAEK
jgi:thiol-disulfide isomerase/thioredoxin